VMTYLLGGNERRKRMIEMFQMLYRENVEVFVLTKNRGCPSYTDYFLDMVRLVAGPNFPSDHLICSREYAKKSEALKKNNEFDRITRGDRLICQARKANGERCTAHSVLSGLSGLSGLCRTHEKSLNIKCPPGKERAPDHATKCLVKCTSGRVRNVETLRCRNVRKSITRKRNSKSKNK